MKDSISQIKEMISDIKDNLTALEQIIEKPVVTTAINSLDNELEGVREEA